MTVTFNDTPGRKVAFRTLLVAFGHLLGLMSLIHKKEGPLKLLKNPKSTFYRIWSVFGGVSNSSPISADYSLKSQIGIGKNWVAPPPPPNSTFLSILTVGDPGFRLWGFRLWGFERWGFERWGFRRWGFRRWGFRCWGFRCWGFERYTITDNHHV